MSRPLRVEFPGACYHVINRGNYRRSLFEGEGASASFEKALGEAAERFGWRVHAFVIMRNHFHLAVQLGEPNLSEGMKWLQGTWIRRYNRLRQLIGRPFQGRYKALLVEPGFSFGQVCHYIHLNPVRAHLVSPATARQYRGSSLHWFLQKKRPAWLCADTVLQSAGSLADTPAGWKRYLAHLEFLAADTAAQRELVAAKLSRGWCVGTLTFKQRMQQEALARGILLDSQHYAGLEPAQLSAERDRAWEEKLSALATAADVNLAKLGPRKSDPAKVLLAAALKSTTSVSNAWLAQRLAMGQPASASQFVRRLLLTTEGKAAAERLLSRASRGRQVLTLDKIAARPRRSRHAATAARRVSRGLLPCDQSRQLPPLPV